MASNGSNHNLTLPVSMNNSVYISCIKVTKHVYNEVSNVLNVSRIYKKQCDVLRDQYKIINLI